MSQIELLEIIRNNPGIEQRALHKLTNSGRGAVSEQVRKLTIKKDIHRVASSPTWRLYANEV